ncbi:MULTISPECIES: alpha/beta fold hydrolase [Streptomycetaceae]|uniref:Esterase/lipase/thioesterase n=1 Tax=Streptantibioticus cattleyicolor (strain ATCC 35852 / DSM 46488 / JCM 4925 / NBRC 14057 / NRRL 8057) TaxID=1003195 RepID=F8JV11_STREN|nr:MULTISPECIES: alpha/beta hydrolase [Streptomycetaceae]AEW98180.1 esterase/lipase/thioesterase [Streptantibioticus cattleyicolor NRRL 8057 = DSM 46488]MYS62563.1 alpha/beta fold hydrolase [Streptomyces sp. SID5468]CCB78495.1 Esterase/lipase/thioesterase [Streptantibioticus cattleyicolor NRRL 8057 = DSM 46488]
MTRTPDHPTAQPGRPAVTGSVHAGGADIAYTAAGRGPGLLLVHGSTADSEANYAGLRPLLTGHRTVITADYAGSGATALPPGGELTVDLLAEQMAAVIRAAGPGPVDVAGASLGAVVAAALAAAHPHLVRRLVLIGGWARNDDPRQRLALGLWHHLARTDRTAYQQFITLLSLSPQALSALGPDGIARAAAAAEPTEGAIRQIELDLAADIRDRLPHITAPTLVIGARQDQVIPVTHARELHQAIAGSRYAELDCGHNIPFEAPADLARLIDTFLT